MRHVHRAVGVSPFRALNGGRMPNEINWSRNYDRSRQEAATTKRPLLADFSAAPM